MTAILFVIGIIATTLLGGSNPFSSTRLPNGGHQVDPNAANQTSCLPQINTSRTMKVDVRNGLEPFYVNNKHSEFNKENDEWVLVKENAPIAAWKVDLETGGDKPIHLGRQVSEMEYMGSAIGLGNNPDNGKEVWIGTGWCDPATGRGFSLGGGSDALCLDPLVQDALFVVTRKGLTREEYNNLSEPVTCPEFFGTVERPHWAGCHAWGEGTAPAEMYEKYPKTQENLNKFWWTFNVYYKASKLPANPTYADLPCWMKLQCSNMTDVFGDRRRNAAEEENCEVDDLIGQSHHQSIAQKENRTLGLASKALAQGGLDDKRPKLIIKTAAPFMTITGSLPSGVELAPEYISLTKLTEGPNSGDKKVGTAYSNHFDVYIRTGNTSGTSSNHVIILDPTPAGHPEGPFWAYVPILATSKPQANSLQLGSFVPGIPSFFYEWWTPSCKPAIYLYPEKEMALSVKVKPEGFITESIPEHGDEGWNVIAKPDGTILNNVVARPWRAEADQGSAATYPYLYYEASLKQLFIPKTTGWIRTRTELPAFFAETLPQLGLNEKEQKDFLEYWIPKLQEGEKWYITLIDRNELDRVEPIEFSQNPDTFIRVRFYFENLDKNSLFSPITNYQLPTSPVKRGGFTAVDWGGIIGNGSCGVGEVVK